MLYLTKEQYLAKPKEERGSEDVNGTPRATLRRFVPERGNVFLPVTFVKPNGGGEYEEDQSIPVEDSQVNRDRIKRIMGRYRYELRDPAIRPETVEDMTLLLDKLDELLEMERRAEEVRDQKHGDRYGSLWMDTFNFILTGKK